MLPSYDIFCLGSRSPQYVMEEKIYQYTGKQLSFTYKGKSISLGKTPGNFRFRK